jgi:hypothetical protein
MGLSCKQRLTLEENSEQLKASFKITSEGSSKIGVWRKRESREKKALPQLVRNFLLQHSGTKFLQTKIPKLRSSLQINFTLTRACFSPSAVAGEVPAGVAGIVWASADVK